MQFEKQVNIAFFNISQKTNIPNILEYDQKRLSKVASNGKALFSIRFFILWLKIYIKLHFNIKY